MPRSWLEMSSQRWKQIQLRLASGKKSASTSTTPHGMSMRVRGLRNVEGEAEMDALLGGDGELVEDIDDFHLRLAGEEADFAVERLAALGLGFDE